MGYFDGLVYMGGGGAKKPPVQLWHLTSENHKTWYNYSMR